MKETGGESLEGAAMKDWLLFVYEYRRRELLLRSSVPVSQFTAQISDCW